jgi:hypothetical protein
MPRRDQVTASIEPPTVSLCSPAAGPIFMHRGRASTTGGAGPVTSRTAAGVVRAPACPALPSTGRWQNSRSAPQSDPIRRTRGSRRRGLRPSGIEQTPARLKCSPWPEPSMVESAGFRRNERLRRKRVFARWPALLYWAGDASRLLPPSLDPGLAVEGSFHSLDCACSLRLVRGTDRP